MIKKTLLKLIIYLYWILKKCYFFSSSLFIMFARIFQFNLRIHKKLKILRKYFVFIFLDNFSLIYRWKMFFIF
jgi:hypothetical protein